MGQVLKSYRRALRGNFPLGIQSIGRSRQSAIHEETHSDLQRLGQDTDSVWANMLHSLDHKVTFTGCDGYYRSYRYDC